MSNFYVEKEKRGEFEEDIRKAVSGENLFEFPDFDKFGTKKFWKSKKDYYIFSKEAMADLTLIVLHLIKFKEGNLSQQQFYDFVEEHCKDKTIQIKLLEDAVGNRDFSICWAEENDVDPIKNK